MTEVSRPNSFHGLDLQKPNGKVLFHLSSVHAFRIDTEK